ncbi:MAG: alpha-1,2-fucosyltransferase [Actinobacteria bacterium]|nr:alpha-1,2-fucosyltransferase [Actinomycetota bacterium]
MFQYMAGAGLAKETRRELLINTNWFLNPKILSRNNPAYLTKRKIDIIQFKEIAATHIDRWPTPRDGRMERLISKMSESRRLSLGVASENDFENGCWKKGHELKRLFGFFMSPKFFLGVTPKSLFGTLDPPMSAWSRETIEEIEKTKSIGVHIRLGDYVSLGDKVIPSEAYFLAGVKYLKSVLGKESKIYLFTDEPNRLSDLFQTLTAKGIVISPPSHTTPAENLIVLSKCNAFVCSNSTFSWWGAALSGVSSSLLVRPSYFYTERSEVDSHSDLWSLDSARLHPLSGDFV